jgi:hypothetical protein
MNGDRYRFLTRWVFGLVSTTAVLAVGLDLLLGVVQPVLTRIAWVCVGFGIGVEVTGDRRRYVPVRTPPHNAARRLVAALAMGVAISGPILAGSGTALAQPASGTDRLEPTARARLWALPSPWRPMVGRTTPLTPRIAASIPASLESPPSPPVNGADLPTVSVVVGDTPWGIAERHLGHGSRWRELWRLNRGQTQADGRAWVIEDLIRPGWHLRLPADVTDARPAAPAPSAPHRSGPNPAASSPTGASPADRPTRPHGNPHRRPPTNGANNSDTSRPQDDPPTAAPQVPTVGSSPPPPDVTDEKPGTRDRSASDGGQDLFPALVGLTGATVSSAGLVSLIRRRRERRSVTTGRNDGPSLPSDQQPAEIATTTASDLPLERWAGHHLATLINTPPRHVEGGLLAVELSAENGIELLWDTPKLAAPSPWTAADGGWAWHLSYHPDESIPLDDQPPALPGLVRIGTRQGRQLLIDLEAFGSISLAGDPHRVSDLARAITADLGTSAGRARTQVIVADLNPLGIDQLPGVRTGTTEAALDELRSTAGASSGALDQPGSPSTFHDQTGNERSAMTVIVAPADVTSLIEEAPARRRGVATILVGSASDAAARITVDHEGAAELEPLGIKFQATGLPAPTAATTNEQPHHLSTDVKLHPSPEPGGAASAPTDPLASLSHDEPGHDGSFDEPPWPEILVKVLGRPHVPTRPNLRRRELALVVYLASKGKPTPAGSVQHAVWGGRSVQTKTIWNLATATRAALGQLADGRPAMPPSQRAHNTLTVAPEVRTDLQVLEDLYHAAQHASSTQAIDLLRRGLDLIEGQPFDSPDSEWAHHTELLVAQGNRLIEDATELLLDLATTAGRADLARHAITQGLRALPGNEPLYRGRMTLEHDQGNLAAVHTAYTELETYLTDIDTEPSPATIDLYRTLLRQPGRRAS